MSNTTSPISILFEMASKSKFRYPYKGMITTEDLWDLDTKQLDTVYRNLNKELKEVDGDSLIAAKSADEGVKANDLNNKIEVVKHVFNNKQQAAELARMAAANAAKRQRVLDILAHKQDNALENMSEDELIAMLNDIG